MANSQSNRPKDSTLAGAEHDVLRFRLALSSDRAATLPILDRELQSPTLGTIIGGSCHHLSRPRAFFFFLLFLPLTMYGQLTRPLPIPRSPKPAAPAAPKPGLRPPRP